MKNFYIVPQVRRIVCYEPEQDLLNGSVVNPQTKIETAGQKVEDHSFSADGFNSTWE